VSDQVSTFSCRKQRGRCHLLSQGLRRSTEHVLSSPWCQNQGRLDRLRLTSAQAYGGVAGSQERKNWDLPIHQFTKRGVPITILQEKKGFDHFLPICRRCIGRRARQAVRVAYILSHVLLFRFQKTQEVPYSCHFLPHAPQSDTYDFRREDSSSDLLDKAPPPSGMTVARCPETHFRELPLHHLWEQECAKHDSALKSSPFCSRRPLCHSALTNMYTASVKEGIAEAS